MNYCIDSSVDEPIMLINKHIGMDADEGQGIDGALFQQELLALDAMGKKRIQVWINSPGGNVDEGMLIYHAILNTKTKVDTYNCFMACSIAAVIFEAGRTRYISDYALLMFHSPYYTKDAKSGDNTVLDLFRQSCVTAIAQRSGKTEAEIDTMLNKDTWIDATEAVRTGFADEIQESADYNKKRINVKNTAAERSNPRALWNKGNKILASIFKPDNDMKKIAAALKLNEEANETSILESINALLNKPSELQAKFDIQAKSLADMKADLDAATEKCKTLQTDYDVMKAKADMDEEEAKAAKQAVNKDKAKALVEIHVKAGRIKNDPAIVAKWEAKAEADYDDTKEIIEAIALNAQAAKMETINAGALPGVTAQARMFQIEAKNAAKKK